MRAEGSTAAQPAIVRLHPDDDVAIARDRLLAGTSIELEDGPEIQVRQEVPAGHKVALRPITAGQPVLRYGQPIGLTTQAIAAGDHVHTHNLGLGLPGTEAVSPAAARQGPAPLKSAAHTFLGYQRPDGRVGTRNYVAVISTVNCSAHVTRQIARSFGAERLAAYPNVDGVVAFTHGSGCTLRPGSRELLLLQRTLAGIACHPNVGGYLLVGLGCETNTLDSLAERCAACTAERRGLVIQEAGGIRRAIEAGIALVEGLLPEANASRRTPQPLSALVVALQCGGSDAWSGVTANPAVGLVADEIVRQGGTILLGETPEIYGAEHLLLRRAASPQVAEELMQQVAWWEEHARAQGTDIDRNRSPGNEAGGLTTIYEKSLGAVAKGGSTPLIAVYDYAQPVTARGLAFMNTPGYDPIAVTGQLAGGCNLVLFTTGRGSVFGSLPAPTLKICSNPATYQHMRDDMDVDAGRILQGVPLPRIASEILELAVAVASGQPSKSEAQGTGEAEFCPWSLGGAL
jgi:altronate hydrolase